MDTKAGSNGFGGQDLSKSLGSLPLRHERLTATRRRPAKHSFRQCLSFNRQREARGFRHASSVLPRLTATNTLPSVQAHSFQNEVRPHVPLHDRGARARVLFGRLSPAPELGLGAASFCDEGAFCLLHRSACASALARRAEAEVVVAVPWLVPVAVGRPCVPGGVVETAATVHTVRGGWTQPRTS
ncbi:MAG: hypothetical protein ACI835_004460 [Planctomycetota bacterium]